MAFLMSQPNSKRKRKLGIAVGSVTVVFGIALFVLWYFPALSFRPVIFTDGPNNVGTEWQTLLFIRVNENIENFPSEEEARRNFDGRIARAETVIQRTTHTAGLPNVDEQVLGTFINSLNERRYSIVRLEKKNVYQTYAPSLRYALAFDKCCRGRYH
jgi:hypothetical protein